MVVCAVQLPAGWSAVLCRSSGAWGVEGLVRRSVPRKLRIVVEFGMCRVERRPMCSPCGKVWVGERVSVRS